VGVAAFGALAGSGAASQAVAGLRADTAISTTLLLIAAALAWRARTQAAHAPKQARCAPRLDGSR
jgi:DHA2 family methylenomycin A resistance protein-like MFS transporter